MSRVTKEEKNSRRKIKWVSCMEIIFDNISLKLGGKYIFKALNLKFSSDKIYVIKGANGSGKSTLLKLAAHILRPDFGKVIVKSEGTELKGREYQNKIAMLTPEMRLYENLTADENLRFFAGLRGKKPKDGDVLRLWERVGLRKNETEGKFAINLSTGMSQRVKFAIFLSADASVWLLDEPTANLDDAGREMIIAEIKKAQKNKLVILATNDEREFSVADEIVEL